MKNIISILICFLLSHSLQAEPVGTTFTYQGEILFNNSPMEGRYELQFRLFDAFNGGNLISTHNPVFADINGGLINIELDFGDAPFSGDATFLEIGIGPIVENEQSNNGGGGGSEIEILSPRQRIRVTPYAIQSAFVENDTVWVPEIGGIRHSQGDVIVGSNGASNGADFQVLGEPSSDPVRVMVNQSTRFMVHRNGGVSVGANVVPADRGLYVEGPARQPANAHGLIKAGAIINCGANPAIVRSFNNVNTDEISIGFSVTQPRCNIEIPFDLSDSYLVASAVPTGDGIFSPVNVSCTNGSVNGTIICAAKTDNDLPAIDEAVIQLLIY